MDKDGNEVDWIVGYGPPPDDFLAKVNATLAGADTFKALSARYAKNPGNIEAVFKLARKYEDRYSMLEKVKELYQRVLDLDPRGTAGTADIDYPKAKVAYTEYAEYALAGQDLSTRTPDIKAMESFIRKYPESQLLKNAYAQLSRYYGYNAPKDEAAKFFGTYTSKFPEDAVVLTSYIQRIIRDKDPLDKGIELAEKVNAIVGYPRNPAYMQNLAQLHVLKGDKTRADEIYGKDFAASMVSTTTSSLLAYANFWLSQDKNLESAEAMTDTAVQLSPDTGYILQRAADVYIKLGKNEKALDIFGPGYALNNAEDPAALYSYASFWNRQGQNLDSALDAAGKAAADSSDYYTHFALGQILFKLKRYEEALAAAEKAVALVKPVAAKYEGFPVQQYENLVKQIKEALAKK